MERKIQYVVSTACVYAAGIGVDRQENHLRFKLATKRTRSQPTSRASLKTTRLTASSFRYPCIPTPDCSSIGPICWKSIVMTRRPRPGKNSRRWPRRYRKANARQVTRIFRASSLKAGPVRASPATRWNGFTAMVAAHCRAGQKSHYQ